MTNISSWSGPAAIIIIKYSGIDCTEKGNLNNRHACTVIVDSLNSAYLHVMMTLIDVVLVEVNFCEDSVTSYTQL